MEIIDKFIKEAHDNAVKHGFYQEKREIGTLLMLVVSELSEALEADRKGLHANLFDELNDEEIKNSFECEIADVFIRLFDLCGFLNIDIQRFIEWKMQYNAKRDYKHGKKY